MTAAAERTDAAAAYLGLGTNLGDRGVNLASAIAALAGVGRVVRVSSVYESVAVGHVEQPNFWNMALLLHTALSPVELLTAVKAIEVQLGRVPSFRMGPRLIDIDILMYGRAVLDTAALQLPHPGLLERSFVLRPLLDVAPAITHPVTGEPLADAARKLESAVERIGSAADVLGRHGLHSDDPVDGELERRTE